MLDFALPEYELTEGRNVWVIKKKGNPRNVANIQYDSILKVITIEWRKETEQKIISAFEDKLDFQGSPYTRRREQAVRRARPLIKESEETLKLNEWSLEKSIQVKKLKITPKEAKNL